MANIEPLKPVKIEMKKPNSATESTTANKMENNSTKPGIINIDKYKIPADDGKLSLNITLVTPPPQKIAIYENVTFLVATIGFIGVFLTVALGYWRMRKELKQALDLANAVRVDAREQANDDRELTRDQANQERQHSADEAHRERIATSRRIVYLDTAKQVVKANALLGSLMGKKINNNSALVELTDLGVAVSQITILGEMNTVLKSREVLSLINQSYFRAMAHSFPIASLNEEIRVFSEKNEKVRAEIEKTQEKINRLSLAGLDASGIFDLRESLKYNRKLSSEMASKIEDNYINLSKLHMSYFDFMLGEIKEINKGTDELIVMIRAELELSTDAVALAQSSLVMHSLATKAKDELKVAVEALSS
ncbi:hypothetical protein [Janthinobacterium lividum]|uniref:hypothetical protein n=1 Tax=Janthinobacterium lividum TaxID=29581 RepID=UPI0004507458|nr:hypothetical protein [Janthinobacterium lividum]EZP41011.1 hypothetical protein BW37_00960 [Janthinobacterium lividum]